MRRTFCLAAAMIVAAFTETAAAAEIKILAPRAIFTVLQEAGPQFEGTTGHKINVSVDLAAVVVRRVNSGEDFDIAVAAPAQIDGLVKDGKLIADTRTDLTRSGIGVEVRKGAPKPDISSVEAFKKAMRDAKSVGYLKVGTSGLMVAAMLERTGLTDPQRGYAESIQYSLRALYSFVERYGTKNTVLVVLGDEQPARIIEPAGREVPITIIAHDPNVIRRLASWGWTDGMLPAPTAPVWLEGAFRDRFFNAFDH